MRIYKPNQIINKLPKAVLAVIPLLLALTLIIGLNPAFAQGKRAVQVINDQLALDERHLYSIKNLHPGDTLYVYLEGTAGNLDPMAALADARIGAETLGAAYEEKLLLAIEEGRDPLEVIPEIADELFLTWDDDSGKGYDAAFNFEVPAEGEYLLIVLSSPGSFSSGDYTLTLGINEPKVITEDVKPTGDEIAILHQEASQAGVVVQEITGALSGDNPATFYFLDTINAGDTLYAYIEATSGDLKPILTLRDYGDKPIRSGNVFGKETSGSLSYKFEEKETSYKLRVESCCEGEGRTEGNYRLLVGINEPEVLSGEAGTTDQTIIKQPLDVKIGVKIDQITDIDQKAENFTVVADLEFEWQDPSLAFSPDTCNCAFKTFTEKGFDDFIKQTEGKWPDFSLTNQQGNRWIQNKVVVVFPDGRAIYFERFTTTFQAPDFEFSKFPFDTQLFNVHVLSLYPEEFLIYSDLDGYSGMGDQLGEEEWDVFNTETSITTVGTNSQFSLHFEAERSLTFYIVRIFIPLLLIIIVAWITFFLKDYTKRIDVTAGNLLLFIAFNFTISSDLPRLGYLTFLDKLLITTFAISVLTLAYNVVLKRLEIAGKGELGIKIDKYMIWVYPITYVVAYAGVTISSL